MTYQLKVPENLQECSMTYQLKVPENLQERSMTYQRKAPENLQVRSMTTLLTQQVHMNVNTCPTPPHPTPPHPCLHAHTGTHRDDSTYPASSHER